MFFEHITDANSVREILRNPHVRVGFSQFGEDIALWSIFETLGVLEGGFYVDVGAYHPHQYSNTYLFYLLKGWRGINIDASARSVELLERYRGDDVNVHAAIAAGGLRS